VQTQDRPDPSATTTTTTRTTDEPGPAVGAPEPRRRHVPTAVAVAAGAVGMLVLGAVGAVVLGQVSMRVHGPQQLAEDYLAALEDGRATDALALVPAAVIEDEYGVISTDLTLMTDAVYAEATDRPTDGRVSEVVVDGTRATITVRYRQGATSVTQTLTARKTGTTAGFVDEWELEPMAHGFIDMGGASVVGTLTVGTQELDASMLWTMTALPGTYTVTGPTSSWFDPEEATVTVRGDGQVTLGTVASPTAAFRAEAAHVVDDVLRRCLSSTLAQPYDCPNSSAAMAGLSDITWTLTTAPEYEIVTDSYSGASLEVSTTTPGTVTVSGTTTGGERSTTTVAFEPSGLVYLEGGIVSYRDYGTY
jgi:hypothetical protein